ncbi:ABC transporter ATP-binding protein [Agromyces protaetiae]|uniref:ABC transporter ATP-binding protein n=1 Tax=Agromyces protaetiae TaxID=2509455 RepID=A0A4P6FCR3_9MICO|nr:ABC transporter ATP-binding protein [Agromyces protaetiae]QAY73674.1 ABC transporter ATP-binding protein [Agromyces protaetiae]
MTERTLETVDLTLGYDGVDIVHDLSTEIPSGKVTAIIGANASGKSTLLRGIARLMTPRSGSVLLDGASVHAMRSGDAARVIGLLPQAPIAPDGITVGDLVGRGRYPHQGWFRRWTEADEAAVDAALEATGTADLVSRRVDELSGGQRQRVWIAMALAQETDILLLDEPTTYLDVNYQIEVLDLLADLNRDRGTTVVMVLHELGLACRYADHLIAMKDGRIAAEGAPNDIVTAQLVDDVFSLACDVIEDPRSGTPMVIPLGRHRLVR